MHCSLSTLMLVIQNFAANHALHPTKTAMRFSSGELCRQELILLGESNA